LATKVAGTPKSIFMRKYSFLLLLLIGFASEMVAQTLLERAKFSFDRQDTCIITSSVGSNFAFPIGEPTCDCGVKGRALEFDGGDDEVILSGDVSGLLRKQDFTISFYFKVRDIDSPIPMIIMANQDSCKFENKFSVSYRPSSKILNVTMVEDSDNIGSLIDTIPGNNCWNHVVITRANKRTRLYANGEFLTQKIASGNERVDLEDDDNILKLGASDCPNDFHFDGWLDEVDFFQNAMSADQVRAAYLAPEKIGNGKFSLGVKDTTIFLGGSVEGFITSKCPDVDIDWTPTTGIPSGQEDDTNPILSPAMTTVYYATFSDAFCSTEDSLLITVIDPNDLDCTELFLPTAFTPNGDDLNDVFGISNAVVMTELYSFEIFDRWGNIVFATDQTNVQWDGLYQGSRVNSNTFVYKIAYRCKTEDLVRTGTVTVMR
jgi:gliding motility-associated-like protein